jgi:hypothetical protein
MPARDHKPNLEQAASVLVEALIRAASQHRELLQAIHTLTGAMLVERAATAESQPPPSTPPTAPPQSAPDSVPQSHLSVSAARLREPLIAPAAPPHPTSRPAPAMPAGNGAVIETLPFTPRPAMISGPTPPSVPPPPPPPDLSRSTKRARLKADACRWSIERRRRLAEGADPATAIKPTTDELVARAKAIGDCYLWTLDAYRNLPDDAHLEQIAAAYENLALAAELAARVTDDADANNDTIAESFHLLAEAQSALRTALEWAEFKNDRDQLDGYFWLKDQTFAHRIYVDRYMKLEDPADPDNWHDLQTRLQGFAERLARRESTVRKRQELLSRGRYHVKRLLAGGSGASSDETGRDREQIINTVQEWVAQRFPPTDRELCQLLLPILDQLDPSDDSLSAEAQRGLEAARQFAQSRAAQTDSDEHRVAERERPERVRQAADLLRGKVVVIIGGEERADQKERLERDLELGELRWVPTVEHEALHRLEPDCIRPDVDVVLLPIRLTSHSHGELRRVCEEHGKVFITLPSGWNPTQVAEQVLNQASDRLGRAVNLTW